MTNKTTTKTGSYMGLSVDQYAAAHNTTAELVKAARDVGQLTLCLDGSINPDSARIGLTPAAYSRLRNTSRQSVNQAGNNGWLIYHVDGSIDAEKSTAKWDATARSRPEGGQVASKKTALNAPVDAISADSDSLSYKTERAKREAANVRILNVKAAQAEGLAVSLPEMEIFTFNILRATRNALQDLPDRLSGQLTGLTDEKDIYNILTDNILKITEDLATEFDDMAMQSTEQPISTKKAGS